MMKRITKTFYSVEIIDSWLKLPYNKSEIEWYDDLNKAKERLNNSDSPFKIVTHTFSNEIVINYLNEIINNKFYNGNAVL